MMTNLATNAVDNWHLLITSSQPSTEEAKPSTDLKFLIVPTQVLFGSSHPTRFINAWIKVDMSVVK